MQTNQKDCSHSHRTRSSEQMFCIWWILENWFVSVCWINNGITYFWEEKLFYVICIKKTKLDLLAVQLSGYIHQPIRGNFEPKPCYYMYKLKSQSARSNVQHIDPFVSIDYIQQHGTVASLLLKVLQNHQLLPKNGLIIHKANHFYHNVALLLNL